MATGHVDPNAPATGICYITSILTLNSCQCMGWWYASRRCLRKSIFVNFLICNKLFTLKQLFPCPTCGNAAGQVQQVVNYLSSHGTRYGMLWLDIEGPQYWYKDQATNRNFFAELVNEAKALGVHLGIYSSESQVKKGNSKSNLISGFQFLEIGTVLLRILCGMLTTMVLPTLMTFPVLLDGPRLQSSNTQELLPLADVELT
jgi:hypothetical protein